MIGVGVAGAYMCAPVCVSVYIITRFSTQSCQPHFISFTESLQWDLGVLSPSRVHGICWDKTLSKASLKRVWIFTEEKKRRERCKYIWGGFFFLSFLAVFATENSRALPCLSGLAQRGQYAHIRHQRTALLHAFLGRKVCEDVVYLRWGVGVQISEGWGQIQANWVFKIKKYNWLKRRGRKADLKRYIFFFIAIPPIERTFCWVGRGGCLPRTSNSVCSTILFLNSSADFIPGML